MIILRDIDFFYAARDILFREFNFQLEGKGIFSIIGPSGIGKSTLLKLIGGIVSPKRGDLQFYPQTPRISLVSQYPTPLPFRTVRQNLRLPAQLFKDQDIYQYAKDLAHQLGLGEHLDVLASQLSGGMKSRVSIIKAVSVKPDFLLLDEPFASLDEINKNIIIRLIQKLVNERAMSVLLVTHNIMDALLFSDVIYLFLEKPITSLYKPILDSNQECNYKKIVDLMESNWSQK
ncbi:MAG: ATP-binding cassette domain-containing protein [Waterburya sp.]